MKTRQVFHCALLLIVAAVPVHAQSIRVEAEGGAAALLGLAKQDYERTNAPATQLSVAASNTASAIGRLCRGEIAIAGVARTMTSAERSTCSQNRIDLLELPLASDAVALVVNPANTWAKEVSLDELRRAWLDTPGKATSWRKLNPAWPDIALKLYGPGPKMGLGATLRNALQGSSAPATPELRRDITATDVLPIVIDAVARDRAALGMLDRASYATNAKRVRLVRVTGQGTSASQGTDGALGFALHLYVRSEVLEDADAKGYLAHLYANAERFASDAGLVPLGASTYREAHSRISTKR
jgi:phosphate transport system substrate-binding protein